MEFVKTRSTLSESMECVENGYKVTVNVSLEKGVIKSINGSVAPAEVPEGQYVEGVYFNAYKRGEEWRTDVGEVSNAEYAKVTALAIESVNYVVAQYEAE
jgi:hypothetical protein